MLQPALQSNFTVRIFLLQSISEVNQSVTMQKLIHRLPGYWGQPMLSVTAKTVAHRGTLYLFLSCEKMFLPTKVSVFMA